MSSQTSFAGGSQSSAGQRGIVSIEPSEHSYVHVFDLRSSSVLTHPSPREKGSVRWLDQGAQDTHRVLERLCNTPQWWHRPDRQNCRSDQPVQRDCPPRTHIGCDCLPYGRQLDLYESNVQCLRRSLEPQGERVQSSNHRGRRRIWTGSRPDYSRLVLYPTRPIKITNYCSACHVDGQNWSS